MIEPRPSFVSDEVREELPQLRVWTAECDGGDGRSPREVRERLRRLSDRMRGAQAIAMRTQAVPHAYRVLFRHLGLDPDSQRPPGEQVVLDRLVDGGYRSVGRIGDALVLALIETGVPVWALDAAAVEGPLQLRTARPGEELGPDAAPLPPGRLVLADRTGPVAALFGEPAARLRPRRSTTRVLLVAVQAPGVPAIHVEEALWTAAEVLAS